MSNSSWDPTGNDPLSERGRTDATAPLPSGGSSTWEPPAQLEGGASPAGEPDRTTPMVPPTLGHPTEPEPGTAPAQATYPAQPTYAAQSPYAAQPSHTSQPTYPAQATHQGQPGQPSYTMQQGPYQAGGGFQPYYQQATRDTSGAMTLLIVGIVMTMTCCQLGGLPAIICGAIGLSGNRSQEEIDKTVRTGWIVTGVLGGLMLLLGILYWVVMIAGVGAGLGTSHSTVGGS